MTGLGEPYLDKLTGRNEQAAGDWDRHRSHGSHLPPARCLVSVQDGERTTRVVNGNHDSVVVWTPGRKGPAPWPT